MLEYKTQCLFPLKSNLTPKYKQAKKYKKKHKLIQNQKSLT